MCLLLTGCGKNAAAPAGSSANPPEVKAELNRLKTISSYSDVFTKMNNYFKESRSSVPEDGALTEEAIPEEAAETPAEAPASADTAVNTTAAKATGDYSETNVQVEGIDEADIIKTDGEYIYYLSGNTLKIIRTNGAETQTVSETKLSVENENMSKYFSDMYLSGTSLVVLGNRYDYNEGKDAAIASIYDVSDKSAPKLLEEFGQSGYISSTRMVGDILYVITTYTVWEWNMDEDVPDTYVPVLYRNETSEVVPVTDICCPEEVNNTSWVTVSAYSIADRERISTTTMLGRADNMYMGNDNIYVAENVWVTDESDPYTQDQYKVVDYTNYSKTNIYKFSYDQGQVEYLCSGVVVGGLLDQFSMDEYNGNLRVVTTRRDNSYKVYTDEKYNFNNYEYGSDSMDNGLYVFDENMKVIGSVEKLGEDERVYSVRFNGDVGYFVTFRETDPLFAVDLSDPANPTVLSALKINGFSQYLHPWGDGLLLGLGMDADDEGNVGSMKLSMFNTSDPTDVTEQDKTVIPYYYSNGLYNHHAVFVDPERGLVGFGVEGDSGVSYVLYKYENGGFTQLAKLTNGTYDYDSRGLRIENWFYVVSESGVTAVDLTTGQAVQG